MIKIIQKLPEFRSFIYDSKNLESVWNHESNNNKND